MALISGRDLTHANPAASYVSDRNVDTLKRLKVLSDAQAAVLRRANEIGLGNRDAVTQATEVSRILQPDAFATLFPDEQLALQGSSAAGPAPIWAPFEIGNASSPAAQLPRLKVTETPSRLAPLDLDRAFQISTLPAQWQRIAQRVELTLDRDGTPPTIQYADVLSALTAGNVEKYTPTEVDQIRQLQKYFLDTLLVRAVTPPGIEVSKLGEQSMNVSVAADLPVTLSWTDELTQQFTGQHGEMTLSRRAGTLQFEVPPGTRALVNNKEIDDPGRVAMPASPGAYLIELFDAAGKKVTDTTFSIPSIDQQLNLSRYDRRPVSVEGGPRLEGQLLSSTATASRWALVPEGTAVDGPEAAQARQRLAIPQSTLKDGVYQFQAGRHTIKLEKFPGPVYQVTADGQKHDMKYQADAWSSNRMDFLYSDDNVILRFIPETNTFGQWWRTDTGAPNRVVTDLDFVQQ